MLVGYSGSRPPLTTNNGLFRRLLREELFADAHATDSPRIMMKPFSGRKLAYGVVSRIAM